MTDERILLANGYLIRNHNYGPSIALNKEIYLVQTINARIQMWHVVRFRSFTNLLRRAVMPETKDNFELNRKTQLRINILVLSQGSYSGSGFQYAIARSLGSRGALLDEVKYPVHPGDLLRIGYKKRRAKARVLWVCEVGDIQPFQIGIELLPDEPCPWTRELRALGSNKCYDGRDRRRHERVSIDLQVDINGANGINHSIDISAGGLYVATSANIVVGTAITLGIWLRKKRFVVNAIVRTVDPGIGVGVEFVGLCDADRKAIGEVIERPLLTRTENNAKPWSSEKANYD